MTFLSTKISSTIDLGDLGIVHMYITRTTIFQVSFWSSILTMEFNLQSNATQIHKLQLLQTKPLHVSVIISKSTTNERNCLKSIPATIKLSTPTAKI